MGKEICTMCGGLSDSLELGNVCTVCVRRGMISNRVSSKIRKQHRERRYEGYSMERKDYRWV